MNRHAVEAVYFLTGQRYVSELSMFQLRQLKIFLAAADSLSFTEAAHVVHLSQPSVTEQIRVLEQTVGQSLFIRKNNRLLLTSAGKKLAKHSRTLLAMADAAFQAIRNNADETSGSIRAAAPHTLCTCLLIPILGDYIELHPGALVELQEKNSLATAHAVAEGKVDFGAVHGWPAHDENVQAHLIGRDAPIVLMPNGHPLCTTTVITPDTLAAYPLVVTERGCRYREFLETFFQLSSKRPRVRGVAESVPALIQMVTMGLGVSILPRIAVSSMTAADPVTLRELSTASDGLPICIITPEPEPPPHVAALIQMLRLAVGYSDKPVAAFDVKHGTSGVSIAK